jgi:hypothetical protein
VRSGINDLSALSIGNCFEFLYLSVLYHFLCLLLVHSSLVQRTPTDCGASLCVIKKPRTRGGYSPAGELQNIDPQWLVAPVEKNY